MEFSLAPMEGITGYVTRNAFHHNFDYIDKLLSDWHEHNLKTPEEVNEYLNNMKQKNKDIKALEKKTKAANYEQRKYDNLDSLYVNLKPNN